MEKTQSYYVIRSIVRGVVGVTGLLAIYILIHLVASNIWAVLAFGAAVTVFVIRHDRKEKAEWAEKDAQTAQTAQAAQAVRETQDVQAV